MINKQQICWVGLVLGFLGLAGCVQVIGRPTVSLGKEAYAVCVTATPDRRQKGNRANKERDAIEAYSTGRLIQEEKQGLEAEKPLYKVEVFGLGDLVHVDRMTIRLIGWDEVATNVAGVTRYRFRFEVTNHTIDGVLVPLSKLIFVRRVQLHDGKIVEGHWVGDAAEAEKRPLGLGEMAVYEISVVAPVGEVLEVGLLTSWRNGVAGGVPIWFLLEAKDSDDCLYGWADYVGGDAPPRPTMHVIGYGGNGNTREIGACVRPLQGRLVRGFGCSQMQTGIKEPFGCDGKTPHFHNGWDIDGYVGDTVVAPISGKVETGFDEGLGIFVRVVGDNGERHDLLHLSSSFVGEGQLVTSGEAIGEVGETGNSFGSHLHWTVRIDGQVIDPAEWGCSA